MMQKKDKEVILKRMNEIAAKSKLTEKDALDIGKRVSKGVAKRFVKC